MEVNKMLSKLNFANWIFKTFMFFLLWIQTSYLAQTKIKRLAVSTSLIEFVPDIKLNTSNYNIGIESKVFQNVTLGFNFGIVKSVGKPQGFFIIPSLSTTGFKAQAELRLYHNRNDEKRRLQGIYYGLQGIYKFTQTKREETVLDYVDNNPFPNSQHFKQNVYTVNRLVSKLNLKLGYQIVIRNFLIIDPSLGFGVQYISSKAENKLGDNLANDEPWGKLFDTGKGIYPNASFQLKMGFVF